MSGEKSGKSRAISDKSPGYPRFANQPLENSETENRGHQFYHLVTVSVFTHASIAFKHLQTTFNTDEILP